MGGGRVAADAELKIEYAASPTPADHFLKGEVRQSVGEETAAHQGLFKVNRKSGDAAAFDESLRKGRRATRLNESVGDRGPYEASQRIADVDAAGTNRLDPVWAAPQWPQNLVPLRILCPQDRHRQAAIEPV